MNEAIMPTLYSFGEIKSRNVLRYYFKAFD
jgi:hypothetical protein